MDLALVISRISERRNALGLSEAALSARVGSKDMIRNWRRSIAQNQPLNVKHASLVAIAAALDVSVDWLTGSAGAIAPTTQIPPGFSEQAIPFTFAAVTTPESGPLPHITRLYGTDITPATYRLAVDLPVFALCAGYILVIDMSRLPQPGELALARVTDEDTASATTVIVRYMPPFLAAGMHGIQGATLRVDQPGVTVRFPVIGSIRGIPAT